MNRRHAFSTLALALVATACRVGGSSDDTKTPTPPAQYDLGSNVVQRQLDSVDIDVDPQGHGLPVGSGTPAAGHVIFEAKCASCHGVNGEGIATIPKLIGRDPRDGFPFGRDVKLVKTVGNYWPYATTLYDYIHRAMPLSAPGSLEPNEVYSVAAWILSENEIIPRDFELNQTTLPKVKMPAAGRFVPDDRKGTTVR